MPRKVVQYSEAFKLRVVGALESGEVCGIAAANLKGEVTHPSVGANGCYCPATGSQRVWLGSFWDRRMLPMLTVPFVGS